MEILIKRIFGLRVQSVDPGTVLRPKVTLRTPPGPTIVKRVEGPLRIRQPDSKLITPDDVNKRQKEGLTELVSENMFVLPWLRVWTDMCLWRDPRKVVVTTDSGWDLVNLVSQTFTPRLQPFKSGEGPIRLYADTIFELQTLTALVCRIKGDAFLMDSDRLYCVGPVSKNLIW